MSNDLLEQTDLVSLEGVTPVIRRLREVASPQSVFGEPVRNGETVVVPCAEVWAAMGMGGGGGNETDESGEGAGSGGSARGRPVAAIVIDPDVVYVEPVLDLTKVALAALTTLAFAVAWWARLSRATKGGKDSGGPSFGEATKAIRS
jgi:uncharacterized spore protein YtfJ